MFRILAAISPVIPRYDIEGKIKRNRNVTTELKMPTISAVFFRCERKPLYSPKSVMRRKKANTGRRMESLIKKANPIAEKTERTADTPRQHRAAIIDPTTPTLSGLSHLNTRFKNYSAQQLILVMSLLNDCAPSFMASDNVGNMCNVSITSSIVILFLIIITASWIKSAA